MGSDKSAIHITLQESHSLKTKMHSGPSASMAATLQLNNEVIVFS